MRNFYLKYSQNANLPPTAAEIEKTKLPPLVAEIGWSHNCVIIEKCKDPLQCEFYIKMTKHFGWTKDVLVNNILCFRRQTRLPELSRGLMLIIL